MSSLNSKAVWGESPLMGAVARGQLEVVKALVEVEAVDVDTVDGQGRTLLQVARCAFCNNLKSAWPPAASSH